LYFIGLPLLICFVDTIKGVEAGSFAEWEQGIEKCSGKHRAATGVKWKSKWYCRSADNWNLWIEENCLRKRRQIKCFGSCTWGEISTASSSFIGNQGKLED